MTKEFDDKARREMVFNFYEKDFIHDGTPVRDMVVKPMTVRNARPYISTFHYSKTMPDSTLYVYAGYLGNNICGIVTYGMGAGKNQYTNIIPSIENGEYVELTRLWCANDMPKNTESKLISESLKMLPPEIKLVMSFADNSKNHNGTIYQATNWHYLGMNDGGKTLVTKDGIEKHVRLLGIYRDRNPHLKNKTNEQIMDIYGWVYGEGGRKHRYVYIRGSKKEKRNVFNKIKDRIESYPKDTDKTNNNLSEKEIVELEREIILENDNYEQLSIFSTS